MGQHAINIVYPIAGERFPKIDPICSIESAYFAASFSVTCSGDHDVKWGFNDETIGNASFYDEFSAQFTWKLPKGHHIFWVKSDCGENRVKFQIG